MNWESRFQVWAQPLSATEQEKCTRAEKAINEAINNDELLSSMRSKIGVFPQGSYCANTNIRQDSDVDICVCLQEPFFCDYPPGKTREDFGLTAGQLTYSEFKNHVENALVKKFGRDSVTRGNKAFDIHKNTYRIDADVVPTLAHRRYTGDYDKDGNHHFIQPTGVEFHPDDGGRVINWPKQTHENGIEKNNRTGRSYKSVIRILKRLRNEMQDENIKQADNIASFLIESLAWNSPDSAFQHATFTEDVRYVLAHSFNHTLDDEKCRNWREVNELKYLFHSTQPWTRAQAHAFLAAAWDYIGFK